MAVSRLTEVVTEETIQSRVSSLCQESDMVAAAVSYVGSDGDQFFPEKHRPTKMRFLVDMSSATVTCGLTNPVGVSKLLRLGAVKSLTGLHSKVILFGPSSALVGSTNLSSNSVENQIQCGLLTRDKAVTGDLWRWFDELWSSASPVREADCKTLAKLFPKRQGRPGGGASQRRARFKRWRAPILEPIQFKIGLSESEKKRILRLFKSNPCGYKSNKGLTCAEGAQRRERELRESSSELRSLVRRVNRWTRADRENMFELAFIDGRAAYIGKPRFLREQPAKVREAMKYLFSKDGDDYIRFEQVAASDGRYRLEGLGRAGVAMLMHLWKPREHAVWNNSVDRGLRVLNVRFNRRHSRHLSQAYLDRTAALKALMSMFGFQSLSATDHFVDAFGKGHLKR